MSVLRFVPILGRRERRAIRAKAIEAAMEGAKERGFISLPFVLTEAEAADIVARWGLSTRLAYRQTAQFVLDNDARNNPSLDERKESDGND